MRIFYASEYKYSIQNGTRLWYNNLYLPLADLGHEIIPFDFNITTHFKYLDFTRDKDKKFIERNRPKLEEELLRQVKTAHRNMKIDIFFSYFYSALCRKEIIEEIKKMGIITINWYCNAAHQFHLVEDIAPAFDFSLVPEKFRLEDYKRVGANPIYFQEAANPNIYKRLKLDETIEVSFVGGKYGDRVELINYLVSRNIPVNVYGSGWKYRLFKDTIKKVLKPNEVEYPIKNKLLKTHNIIEDKKYIELYSKSKICLGFSSCGDTHKNGERILQIRLRDFEAPMSGAFYITEYQKELEEFFEIGKEIVCYKSKDELVDKIKYYLSNEKEREKIAEAGLRRSLAEHTWQKRFEKFFSKYITNK